MSYRLIPFKTDNNDIIYIEKNIIILSKSKVLNTLISGVNITDDMEPILLRNVSTKVLRQILRYLELMFEDLQQTCGQTQQMPNEDESEEEQCTLRKLARYYTMEHYKGNIRRWEIDYFKMDPEEMYEVLDGAFTLGVPSLIMSNCILLSHMLDVAILKSFFPPGIVGNELKNND